MASKQSIKNDVANSKVPEWADPAHQNDPAYEGNALFACKQFHQAMHAYSKAIEKYPTVAQLHANRSLCFSKLNRPLLALYDLEFGLELEPNNEKFILRKCKLMMILRQFEELDKYLNESIDRVGQHLANNKDFVPLIDQLKQRKMEYEQGRYDFTAMVEETKKSKILDKHADYVAPNKLVVRQEVEGKGRGVIAIKKIQPGELLMACEAFVFDDYDLETQLSAVTLDSKLPSMILKTVEKLTHRPDLAADYYRLYAGPKLGHLENWVDYDDDAPLIDMKRILSIDRFNKFGAANTVAVIFEGCTRPAEDQSAGVWIMPSYMNHSCVDTNCLRYTLGDFMFVVATTTIEKGQELTFSYNDPGDSFEQRQSAFRRTFGFECQCRLCSIERQDPHEIKERFEEIREIVSELSKCPLKIQSPAAIARMQRFCTELLECRPQLDLNPLALKIISTLATVQMRTDSEAAFSKREQVVQVRKTNGHYVEALFYAVATVRNARSMKNKRLLEKWMKEAREIAKLIFCGDKCAVDKISTF